MFSICQPNETHISKFAGAQVCIPVLLAGVTHHRTRDKTRQVVVVWVSVVSVVIVVVLVGVGGGMTDNNNAYYPCSCFILSVNPLHFINRLLNCKACVH